jgi:hypothetical protein
MIIFWSYDYHKMIIRWSQDYHKMIAKYLQDDHKKFCEYLSSFYCCLHGTNNSGCLLIKHVNAAYTSKLVRTTRYRFWTGPNRVSGSSLPSHFVSHAPTPSLNPENPTKELKLPFPRFVLYLPISSSRECYCLSFYRHSWYETYPLDSSVSLYVSSSGPVLI